MPGGDRLEETELKIMLCPIMEKKRMLFTAEVR